MATVILRSVLLLILYTSLLFIISTHKSLLFIIANGSLLILQSSWDAGYFRDCNGESNGQDLPLETIEAEKICSGEVEDAEALPIYEEPQPAYEEYDEPQPAYEQPPPPPPPPPPREEPPALYGPPPSETTAAPPPPPPSYLPPAGEARRGRKQGSAPRRPTPRGFNRKPKILIETDFQPPSRPSVTRGGNGGGGGGGGRISTLLQS